MSLFVDQHIRVSVLWLFFYGVAMLGNSYNVSAAEWSIVPKVQFGGEYDDNFRFTTAGDDGVMGSSISPEVNFSRAEPNNTISAGARLKYTQYDSEEISGTSVQFLTLKSNYKTQRSQWRLNAALKSDTTLTTISDDSVLADDAETPSQDVDAGLVEVSVRRNQLSLDPSWKYTLTELTSIQLGYKLTDVSYSDAGGTGLLDRRSHRVNAGMNQKWDENDTVGVKAQLSWFRAPDSGSKTDNISVTASFEHKFMQDLSSNVELGYRETTTTSVTSDENKSDGVVLNAGISKQQTQLTSYNVSLKRDIRSSGVGGEVQSDELAVRLNHKMTPRLSMSLSANAFDNETLEGDLSSIDRVYYSVEPGMQWAMTRDWVINGSYVYRRQKRELDTVAAESNAIFISVNYVMPKVAASR